MAKRIISLFIIAMFFFAISGAAPVPQGRRKPVGMHALLAGPDPRLEPESQDVQADNSRGALVRWV